MRSHGFGYLELVVGVAIVAALAAAGWGLYAEGKASGQAEERVVWQGKETKELTAANAEILRLTKLAQDAEAKRAEDLAKASADYQKGLADEKTKRDRAVAAARTGTLVLRDPGVAAGACPPGGAAAAAQPGAGGRDGPKAGELSREAGAFLLELTGEADDVVRQLTACQAVVRADRAR